VMNAGSAGGRELTTEGEWWFDGHADGLERPWLEWRWQRTSGRENGRTKIRLSFSAGTGGGATVT
jgi:hypothetical protein